MTTLQRISILYDRNFEKLVLYTGTRKHKHYIKRERRLNDLYIKKRRELKWKR